MKFIRRTFIVVVSAAMALPGVSLAGPAPRPSFKEIKRQLVTGFPSFPVYPGAILEKSYEKTENGRIGHEATWEVAAPASEVMTWYLQELPRRGWDIVERPESLSAGELSLTAKKGNQKANLIMDVEDGKTEFSVEFPLRAQTP